MIKLTRREKLVCDELVKGYSNKIIAYNLGIGETTVKSHMRRALEKHGATNRTQLALIHAGVLRSNRWSSVRHVIDAPRWLIEEPELVDA